MSHHRHFRRSYRSAPPKLVPAIISCQTSCCLVFLGIALLIAGSIARFVAGNDSPPSKEFDTKFFNDANFVAGNDSPPSKEFDTKFFNDARSDFAKGPRFVGGILLIIGSAITGVSIIGFIMSCCFYAKYERERHLVTTAQPMPNPIPSNPNMAGAYPHAPTPIQIPVSNVDYPYNMGNQYPGPVVSNGYPSAHISSTWRYTMEGTCATDKWRGKFGNFTLIGNATVNDVATTRTWPAMRECAIRNGTGMSQQELYLKYPYVLERCVQMGIELMSDTFCESLTPVPDVIDPNKCRLFMDCSVDDLLHSNTATVPTTSAIESETDAPHPNPTNKCSLSAHISSTWRYTMEGTCATDKWRGKFDERVCDTERHRKVCPNGNRAQSDAFCESLTPVPDVMDPNKCRLFMDCSVDDLLHSNTATVPTTSAI
ncbi:unnamed protein product, partial [Oppiella nova]